MEKLNPTSQGEPAPPPDYDQGVGVPNQTGYPQPGYGPSTQTPQQPGYGSQHPVSGYGQAQQPGYGPNINVPYGAVPNPYQQQQQAMVMVAAGGPPGFGMNMQAPNMAGAPIWGNQPQSVTCKYCHKKVTTEVEYKIGNCAILICILLFATGLVLCIFIPFCLKSCKDIVHKCSNCKKIVGFSAKGQQGM